MKITKKDLVAYLAKMETFCGQLNVCSRVSYIIMLFIKMVEKNIEVLRLHFRNNIPLTDLKIWALQVKADVTQVEDGSLKVSGLDSVLTLTQAARYCSHLLI